MTEFAFNGIDLEKMFSEIEKLLFDKSKVYPINCEGIDNRKSNSSLFMENNGELYETIGNKGATVYCIWEGSVPVYIGTSDTPWSRIRDHLFRPGKGTKSCIDDVQRAVKDKKTIGVTFVKIKPFYMKTAVEEWLIAKVGKDKLWNERGGQKRGRK